MCRRTGERVVVSGRAVEILGLVWLGVSLGFAPPARGDEKGDAVPRCAGVHAPALPRPEVSLDIVAARPGARVEVPLRLRSPEPLALLAVSVEFDPQALELDGPPALAPELTGAGRPERLFLDHFSDPQEGWIQLVVVAGPGGAAASAIPAAEDGIVALLLLRVRPEVSPGTYPLRFTPSGAASYGGVLLRSNLLPVYQAALPARCPLDEHLFEGEPPVGQGGAVDIVADVGAFQRGDANLDEALDLADPLTILHALFRGGPPLACEPTGDADRDGVVTLSDAVGLLAFLFEVGTSAPAGEGGDLVDCDGS